MPPEAATHPYSLSTGLVFAALAVAIGLFVLIRLVRERRVASRLGKDRALEGDALLEHPEVRSAVVRLYLERRALRQELLARPAWFAPGVEPTPEAILGAVDERIEWSLEAAEALREAGGGEDDPRWGEIQDATWALAEARVALAERRLEEPEAALAAIRS